MEDLPVQGPVFLIEVDKIKPNPQQPRKNFDDEALKELASSIREFGILQPLVVSKIEKEIETGTEVEYQLIAGERRWLASKLLGLERVPAIIRSVALDRERLELAIIENVQRANLDSIETARAYAKLQDQFGLTQREIASRIGKSREVVANTLRLLNLPTQIQEALSKGGVSESQARLLLTISDPQAQQALFEDILKNNLSVREVKLRIQRMQDPALRPAIVAPETTFADPELVSLQRNLEEFLGAKVKLENSGSSGKLTISFYSPEELKGIVQKMLTPQNEPPMSGEPTPFTL
jgi:ParB family chromosome partitioning protein